MKTISNPNKGWLKFRLNKLHSGWWKFHTSGKLEHPNRLNSSWFRQSDGQWIVEEWGEPLSLKLEVALLEAVRASGLTMSGLIRKHDENN